MTRLFLEVPMVYLTASEMRFLQEYATQANITTGEAFRTFGLAAIQQDMLKTTVKSPSSSPEKVEVLSRGIHEIGGGE